MTERVAFFPVLEREQAVLERLRHEDLAGRLGDVVAVLDLVAEADLDSARLERAVGLLEETERGEHIEARFEALERRLTTQLAAEIARIEERLTARLAPEATRPAPERSTTSPAVAEPTSRPTAAVVPDDATIAYKVGNTVIAGASASEFYVDLWRWLFESEYARPEDLPIKTGRQRYEVATEPLHPSGRAFFSPKECIEGVFVETNLSRLDILKRSVRHLERYGVSYEVLLGSSD